VPEPTTAAAPMPEPEPITETDAPWPPIRPNPGEPPKAAIAGMRVLYADWWASVGRPKLPTQLHEDMRDATRSQDVEGLRQAYARAQRIAAHPHIASVDAD
jgi:hypothetical protein